MPVTADLIRELLARGESETLDYKGAPAYDFDANHGKAEFVKDVAAMANMLSVDSDPAYILLGVEEDELGKGIARGFEPHQRFSDDANLQSLMHGKLNRVPRFRFTLENVDETIVGVVEVRSGSRPYFATRSRWGLEENVAWRRRGTRVWPATPQEIWDWAIRDERMALERKKFEAMEAQNRPRGRIQRDANPQAAVRSRGYHYVRWKPTLHNIGPCPCRVISVSGRVEHEKYGQQEVTGANDTSVLLNPGQSRQITVEVPFSEHAKKRDPQPRGYKGSFVVVIESSTGTRTQVHGEIIK